MALSDRSVSPGAERAVVVLVTAPVEEAGSLADALLERQLIACANLVGPVESRYRWEGKLQSEQETLLILKTEARLFEALRAAVVDLHSYDVPEVLALGVEDGHGAYLDWISRCCGPDGTRSGPQVDR